MGGWFLLLVHQGGGLASEVEPEPTPEPSVTLRLIQHLNVVVMSDGIALLDNFDNDPPDGIEDPSSPGPASSWGRGRLFDDVFTGEPVTGEDEHSRNPGGPGSVGASRKRKRRPGGSAIQPNKNTLTEDSRTVGPPPPAFIFSWLMRVEIHVSGLDLYGDDGEQPIFQGSECRQYNPPTIPAPSGDENGALGCQQLNERLQEYMAMLTTRSATAGANASFSWTYVSSGVSGPFASCTTPGEPP